MKKTNQKKVKFDEFLPQQGMLPDCEEQATKRILSDPLLERDETLAAIRCGMEQAERGEGIPLEHAEELLRNKHGFSR